jgi:predicted DNA-binding protein (MmcQ/YjbR family)
VPPFLLPEAFILEMNFNDLEHFCEQLPGAKFDLKWGADRTYCIAEKMFAVFCCDSSAQGSKRLCLKVTPADFIALTDMHGIEPAPYLARYHWVSITENATLPQKELELLIKGSYDMVYSKLSKKKQQSLHSKI